MTPFFISFFPWTRQVHLNFLQGRCNPTVDCYNQLQKYLRCCTVFWHKWPVHDLVLVLPPPPLIKVASNSRRTMLKIWRNNFEWEGGGRSALIISHRPVTSSGFKQERSFSGGSVSTFLQLVVAVLTHVFSNTSILDLPLWTTLFHLPLCLCFIYR